MLASGAAGQELRLEHDLSRLTLEGAANTLQEQLHGQGAHGVGRLGNRGEEGVDLGGVDDVVETRHADVVWYTQPALAQGAKSANGHEVVGGNDSVGLFRIVEERANPAMGVVDEPRSG